jgi:hypothetical protein
MKRPVKIGGSIDQDEFSGHIDSSLFCGLARDASVYAGQISEAARGSIVSDSFRF